MQIVSLQYETLCIRLLNCGRHCSFLTADREFIGAQWFALLMAEPVTRFRIRIRETERLWDGHQSLKTAIVF